MSGATVSELLGAIKPLVKTRRSALVLLRHPDLGDEPLTHVSIRSHRGALVDLYSGTVGDEHTIEVLARELARSIAAGGADFEVNIFHPGFGDEPVQEIGNATDRNAIVLST